MRSRHQISFSQDSLQPDAVNRPDVSTPESKLIFGPAAAVCGALDLLGVEPDGLELALIDETRAEAPVLPVELSEGENPARPSTRAGLSAVPRSQPLNPTRPQLPWGLGTNGWPRHNSRLVRLFACDPDIFVAEVIGQRWDCLSLSTDTRVGADEHLTTPGWPLVIPGSLQMPYASPPLEVELQVQPFHERYARVDIVLRSHYRWPRRYFDVASRCLTRMQRLERRSSLAC